LRSRLDVLQRIEDMRQKLVSTQAGSQLSVYEAMIDRLGIEEQLRTRVGEVQELTHQLSALRSERETFEAGWLREASERLMNVRRETDTLAQQLAAAERRSSLVELRAPADATVLELAQRSVGSVAKEAEPLITLVPLNVPLEAEVTVGALDIGPIRAGDHSRLKLTTLPFQRHGTLSGQVRAIGEDAMPEREGQAGAEPVYRARLTLDPPDLRHVPDDFRLIAGMAVTAEIMIGHRSVISYFLYPILRIFDESLREP
jgi:hemolysin D